MLLEWTLFECRGFPFKQLELHLPLVFSLPAYMQLQACWSNLPGKKVWTGGKKNKPPLHDSSYSHLYPHVSHETLIPIPGQQQMLAEGWHKHGDKHLNTLLWILTMTGHGSSWCRDLPARRQLSVGFVPPKTSLTGWRGGRGGTHKRGDRDRVFPGQAGACQGHFLTAISI